VITNTNKVIELKMAAQTIAGYTTPLLQLNYDCLIQIFQWLDLKSCINAEEAYDELQCVADWTYKRKFTKLTFDFAEPIDLIFHHVGPFIVSLTLILDKIIYTEKQLRKIQDACTQLKRLTLKGFHRCAVKTIPFCSKLEMLSLSGCFLENDADFFDTFKNLKCLSISECRDVSIIAMRKCIENNPGITSFTCDEEYLNYSSLLSLLPNLERLCLDIDNRHLEFMFLTKLNKVQSLTLFCAYTSANNILTNLLELNVLQKLELINVKIDENTYEIIKSLDKLQSLVITTSACEFNTSVALPPKIKYLRLGGFQVSLHKITSLFKRLQHLQNLHFSDCILDHKGTFVTDFKTLSAVIAQCQLFEASRPLHVICTFSGGYTLEVNYLNN
jgi:hypothetical protein